MNTAGVDSAPQYTILRSVLQVIQDADIQDSPSATCAETNRVIMGMSGIEDLYLSVKQANTAEALALYPRLKALVADAADPLGMALRISAAGNIIDAVHMDDYDLWQEVEHAIVQSLQGNGLSPFREALQKANHLLILADNAGETVFDRVLIETLAIPVVYAVKDGPILNDVTQADALAAKIDQVAEIVTNGSATPGTILPMCSPDFLEIFQRADLILAKGQANYETLEDLGSSKVYFLLRIKCPLVGRHIGFQPGNVVLHNTAKKKQK